MIVITGLCDLVKTVVDVINDSGQVPNYQVISPIVLLFSAVSVCVCMRACVTVCVTVCVCLCARTRMWEPKQLKATRHSDRNGSAVPSTFDKGEYN